MSKINLTKKQQMALIKTISKAKIDKLVSHGVKLVGSGQCGSGFFDVFKSIGKIGAKVVGDVYHSVKEPLIKDIVYPLIKAKLTKGKGLRPGGRGLKPASKHGGALVPVGYRRRTKRC